MRSVSLFLCNPECYWNKVSIQHLSRTLPWGQCAIAARLTPSPSPQDSWDWLQSQLLEGRRRDTPSSVSHLLQSHSTQGVESMGLVDPLASVCKHWGLLEFPDLGCMEINPYRLIMKVVIRFITERERHNKIYTDIPTTSKNTVQITSRDNKAE